MKTLASNLKEPSSGNFGEIFPECGNFDVNTNEKLLRLETFGDLRATSDSFSTVSWASHHFPPKHSSHQSTTPDLVRVGLVGSGAMA